MKCAVLCDMIEIHFIEQQEKNLLIFTRYFNEKMLCYKRR